MGRYHSKAMKAGKGAKMTKEISPVVNVVAVSGRVVSEPVLQFKGRGSRVVEFEIEQHVFYLSKRSGETKEQTRHFTVAAWNALASYVQGNFHIGDGIYLHGRLENKPGESGRVRITAEKVEAISG